MPGRANPAAASSAAILSRAACWAGLTSMRHTVSDPRFSRLSTVFYWGHAGRQRMPGDRDSRLHRRLAAVLGVRRRPRASPGRW